MSDDTFLFLFGALNGALIGFFVAMGAVYICVKRASRDINEAVDRMVESRHSQSTTTEES